jgi:hypothetical protein
LRLGCSQTSVLGNAGFREVKFVVRVKHLRQARILTRCPERRTEMSLPGVVHGCVGGRQANLQMPRRRGH